MNGILISPAQYEAINDLLAVVQEAESIVSSHAQHALSLGLNDTYAQASAVYAKLKAARDRCARETGR